MNRDERALPGWPTCRRPGPLRSPIKPSQHSSVERRLDLSLKRRTIAVEPTKPALDFADPLTHILHQLGAASGEPPVDALQLKRIDDGGSIVDECFFLHVAPDDELICQRFADARDVSDFSLLDICRRVDAWISAAPKIKRLPDHHKRPLYPLTWEEQESLFSEVPAYLAQMALFKVNTGCRDQEVCSLRWEWELAIPQLERACSSYRVH